MYTIKKKFTIDLAHIVPTQQFRNPKYECKCRNIHGHTFTIIPIIKAKELDKNTRMVIDYTLIKPFKDVLNRFFDHKFIISDRVPNYEKVVDLINKAKAICNGKEDYDKNITIYKSITLDKKLFTNIDNVTIIHWDSTTAEDMSHFLQYVLADELIKTFELTQEVSVMVGVKETPNSHALYNRPYTITPSIRLTLRRIDRLPLDEKIYVLINNFVPFIKSNNNLYSYVKDVIDKIESLYEQNPEHKHLYKLVNELVDKILNII
jgi:6-pyruvoyl-tetrahydropterin synthase